MSAYRIEIAVSSVKRTFEEALNAVGMHESTRRVLFYERIYRRGIIHRAHLVVHLHNAHKNGFRCDKRAKRFDINGSRPIHGRFNNIVSFCGI